MVAREYQEHAGALDENTPFVEYNYEDGAVGGIAKYVRLASVVYPDGNRTIDYNYAAGVDAVMSRLSSIADSSGTLASYKYLGAGTVVEEQYDSAGIGLSYLDSANNVTGFDRFGRVHEQVWSDAAQNKIDWYTYLHDRAGNRIARDNELHAAFDEDYTYDSVDRLVNSVRADSFDQSWTLDAAGNFAAFNNDGTSQTRTVNAANEITGISGNWKDPKYDAAGNMRYAPKSGAETTGLHFTYDAWNRQAKVYLDDGDGTFEPGTGDALVATYKYDALNRRVEKVVAAGADTHFYYNSNWQLLESRSLTSDPSPLTSVSQYVWSPRYIDAPILRFHDGNADGDLLDATDNVRYYTTDANFNVTTTITITNGVATTQHVVYDAYGKATLYNSTFTTPLGSPTADGPLYCGYFFDLETGNYHVRNRQYVVSVSTWAQRDPMEADINLYRYCTNSPTIYVDPSGLGKNVETGVRGVRFFVEWFPGRGTGEIKILTRWGQELAIAKYVVNEKTGEGVMHVVSRHGGRTLPGVSQSIMKKIAPQVGRQLGNIVQKVGGRWVLTQLAASAQTGGRLGLARVGGQLGKWGAGTALSVIMAFFSLENTCQGAEPVKPQMILLDPTDIGLSKQEIEDIVEHGHSNERGYSIDATPRMDTLPEGGRIYWR